MRRREGRKRNGRRGGKKRTRGGQKGEEWGKDGVEMGEGRGRRKRGKEGRNYIMN